MIPIHVQVVQAGKDGIVVVDTRNNELFRVEAGAMEGNGWAMPDAPGGDGARPMLYVNGAKDGGLMLRDLELGVDYWVSSTGLVSSGCSKIKSP